MAHHVVNLRTADGPAHRSKGSAAERRDYLARQAAAQRAMTTRYAVNLECSLPLPDGQVLTSLQPVDLSLLHPSAARAALASGIVMEALNWPTDQHQPWE
jgi:hypothetical protein